MKELSAGGIIFFEDNENKNIEILMIEDKCHRWTFPKGKIEEGETYKETAMREILEETGIEGEVVKPLNKVCYNYFHSLHDKVEKEVYYYLVKARSKDIIVQKSEINSAKWFNLKEAQKIQKDYGYSNNSEIFKKVIKELKNRFR